MAPKYLDLTPWEIALIIFQKPLAAPHLLFKPQILAEAPN